MSHLTRALHDCPCGRDHTCPISAVEIGEGALDSLPRLCAGFSRVLLVADTNTYAACGKAVEGILGELVASRHVFAGEGVVIPDEASVAAIEGKLTADTDLIVGVGSGVINDLCKFVGHKRGFPYIIVATAPSMDGYASAGAAMILAGMKVTPSATPPMAIVADTRVLREAPMDMIRAGYGDIIGKFSCLNDWRLAAFDVFFPRCIPDGNARQHWSKEVGSIARYRHIARSCAECLTRCNSRYRCNIFSRNKHTEP